MLNNHKYNNIRWQCKRGMLELDEILINFFESKYATLTYLQQQVFELLLQENDADLFSWLFGDELPPNAILQNLILLIKA